MRDRRKYQRRPLLWRAVLQCGSHEFSCWIYDLSLKGAKVRFDLPLAPDCAVVLDIAGVGVLSARVAWSVAGQMGIEFILPAKKVLRLLGSRAKLLGLV